MTCADFGNRCSVQKNAAISDYWLKPKSMELGNTEKKTNFDRI